MKKFYFLLLAFCFFTGINAQVVSIPNANFKTKLLAASASNTIAKNLAGAYFKIDANNNSQIEVSEALQVSYLYMNGSSISSLVGISSFTNLKYLNCAGNSLTTLDVSALLNLEDLWCGFNNISTLNINNLTNLKYLNCAGNNLTNLDVSSFVNLQTLACGDNGMNTLTLGNLPLLEIFLCQSNNLTSLNLTGLVSLRELHCFQNSITSLNVSALVNLDYLSCYNNRLTSLNLDALVNLRTLSCNFNMINSLDVSNSVLLQNLHCTNNNLVYLNMKNGQNEPNLSIYSNPNLRYVCTDEGQTTQIQSMIAQYGYTNCTVNTYCSFVPGGTYYTVQGNNRFDWNNDGCTASDPIYSNLFMKVSDVAGNIISYFISNTSGSYSIPFQAGSYTLTPILENTDYFNITPSSVNISFPTQTSPFNQDFCVSLANPKSDLEVTLLPLTVARPGLDAKYLITYKNKGNTTQSGSVSLAFDDARLDFVSANPATSIQTLNALSWDFTNLLPFETKEIILTLNVNSPIETPAVNGGDVLNYTTTITSPATDEMPSDNTFTFNQTVVNSYDPNDKTCLEGTTIAPSEVGKYAHYMIRFENNGTANAINVVVKDMIDTAKFDINTLVPIKGSHSFVTNITSGNKVEFIFENINLPFDDANNDGYVAFKIKTKPSLVVGNTFSNSASIYFDYNFPIVTNTATTTIAALSNQDFGFSSYFMLYPNPVKDVLTIETKQSIEVSSINIYNQLGQLVLVVPNAQNVSKVDVSGLASGNYFIEINSDKGTSNTKFIKQ